MVLGHVCSACLIAVCKDRRVMVAAALLLMTNNTIHRPCKIVCLLGCVICKLHIQAYIVRSRFRTSLGLTAGPFQPLTRPTASSNCRRTPSSSASSAASAALLICGQGKRGSAVCSTVHGTQKLSSSAVSKLYIGMERSTRRQHVFASVSRQYPAELNKGSEGCPSWARRMPHQ